MYLPYFKYMNCKLDHLCISTIKICYLPIFDNMFKITNWDAHSHYTGFIIIYSIVKIPYLECNTNRYKNVPISYLIQTKIKTLSNEGINLNYVFISLYTFVYVLPTLSFLFTLYNYLQPFEAQPFERPMASAGSSIFFVWFIFVSYMYNILLIVFFTRIGNTMNV